MQVLRTVLQVSPTHFMITALLEAQVGASIRKTEQTGESFINMDLDSLWNLLQSFNQNMQDLVRTALLEKCLHGKTQNQNEVLNDMI